MYAALIFADPEDGTHADVYGPFLDHGAAHEFLHNRVETEGLADEVADNPDRAQVRLITDPTAGQTTVAAEMSTATGSYMRLMSDGRVLWVAGSGLEKDSLIRLPQDDDVHNPAGMAAALRALAEHYEKVAA